MTNIYLQLSTAVEFKPAASTLAGSLVTQATPFLKASFLYVFNISSAQSYFGKYSLLCQ